MVTPAGPPLDGLKFRRQVPIDRYYADFACIEARLVVELDGWSHALTGARDEVRTATIERCGFLELRFSNEDVLNEIDGVLRTILLTARR